MKKAEQIFVYDEDKKELEVINQKINGMLSDYAQNNIKDNIRILVVDVKGDNILLSLLSKGYNKLFGIGNTELIYNMPSYFKIKYTYANPLDTHFPNNFFDFIIAINIDSRSTESTIWTEMGRILVDNGILVIKGSNSANPLPDSNFIRSNLKLISSLKISKDGDSALHVIKSIKITKTNYIKNVCIIHPHLGMNDSHYYLHLRDKFVKDGIDVSVVKSEFDCPVNSIEIYELESGQYFKLPEDHNCIIETHSVLVSNKNFKTKIKVLVLFGLAIFFKKYKNIKRKYIEFLKWEKYYKDNIEHYPNLLLRCNEFGKYLNINRYTLMPHISYDINIKAADKNSPIKIGSFGAAKHYKHFEEICQLGIKLNVPVIIVATVVDEPIAKQESEETAKWLINKFKNFKNIKIFTGYFTNEEIAEKLSSCTHLIFAQDEGRFWTSGSMRFAAALGKPVIASDSWQAKEASVLRVKNIKSITIDFLKNHREAPTIQDGYEYLKNFLLFQYLQEK